MNSKSVPPRTGNNCEYRPIEAMTLLIPFFITVAVAVAETVADNAAGTAAVVTGNAFSDVVVGVLPTAATVVAAPVIIRVVHIDFDFDDSGFITIGIGSIVLVLVR